jgi:hypothetical protein
MQEAAPFIFCSRSKGKILFSKGFLEKYPKKNGGRRGGTHSGVYWPHP